MAIIENKILNSVEIKDESKLELLEHKLALSREKAEKLQFALDSTEARVRELNRSIADLESGKGIDILKEALERFKSTAQDSLMEFQAFLQAVNLNDIYGSNDFAFKQYFKQIEEGSITVQQAIAKVKMEWRDLIETENAQGSGLFDAQQVRTFNTLLESMTKALDDVISRLSRIETEGVKTSGGGGGSGSLAGLADVMKQITEAASMMSDPAKSATETLTKLVTSIGEFSSVDDTKLIGVSNAFRNIANIGEGSFSSKSVDNIIRLAEQISVLNQSGNFQFKFDVEGLKDVKISSTLHHITDLVTVLKDADLSKLQTLGSIDLSGWSNFKVSADSLKNLQELVKTVSVEEEKARQAAATSTALGGERNALALLTAEYGKHIASVSRAAEEEKKKASAAKELVSALKAEQSATSQKQNTQEYKELLSLAKQYKAIGLDMIKLDPQKNGQEYQLLANKAAEIEKQMAAVASTMTMTKEQAAEIAKIYQDIAFAAEKQNAKNQDAAEAKRLAAEEAAAKKQAAEEAKQAAKEEADAKKQAASEAKQAAKEESAAKKEAAAAAKEAAKEEQLRVSQQKQVNNLIQQGVKLSSQYKLLGNNKDVKNINDAVAGLRKLRVEMESGALSTDKAAAKIREFSLQLSNAQTNLRSAGSLLSGWWNTGITQLSSRLAYTFGLVNSVMKSVQAVKKMISTAVELDSAMNQLQIVTRASGTEMDAYAKRVSAMAKETAQSTKDLIDATTVYARLGYSMDESAIMSKYTAMLQNVGAIEASAAQDAVTAIVKAFQFGVDDIETVMDKMVVVGNNFPISVSQIAEGMNNAASMLSVAGNSFEESVALLTAANTTIQNISKASTGLRTIAARIRKMDTEDGEIVEESKYNEMIKTLTRYKVSLVDANGEYRKTYDIIKDIAAVWGEMSTMQQSAVVEALAGTRQQNIFASLMTQFGEAENAIERMKDSAGEMEGAYSIYLDSIQAHVNKLKAAFEELSMDFVDSKFAKAVVDILRVVVEGLDKLINKLGVVGTIVSGIALVKVITNLSTIRMTVIGLIATFKAMRMTAVSTWAEIQTYTIAAAASTNVFVQAVVTARAILAAWGVQIAGIAAAVLLLGTAYQQAHPPLKKLTEQAAKYREEAEQATQETERLAEQIENNKEKIKELNKLKLEGNITEAQQIELENLQKENDELQEQLDLYQKIAKYKGQKSVRATNKAVKSFFVDHAVGSSDFGGVGAAASYTPSSQKEGYEGLMASLQEYAMAQKRVNELKEELNAIGDIETEDDLKKVEKIRADIERAEDTSYEWLDRIMEFEEDLIKYRNALAGETDENSVHNLELINDAITLIDKSIRRSTKTFDSFKSGISSLSDNTLKKLISGAKLTADEFKELKKWMDDNGYAADYASKNLLQYVNELRAAENASKEVSVVTDDNIGDLVSLRDELKQTTEALDAYNKAMEGGEKDDAIKSMAEIYKGALEDIENGKYDTNRLHAAANLFLSEEQQRALGYDMRKVAELLRSQMMQTLFDPEGESELDYGQRFAEYIKKSFSKSNGVWMEGNKFFYDSLGDLSRAFGISEEACAAFLSALDMYGVQVMRSTEDNTRLIEKFREVEVSAEEAGSKLGRIKQFIRELRSEGKDQYDIASILSDFNDWGVINVDKKTLDRTIAEIFKETQEVEDENPTVQFFANIDPAMLNLKTLEDELNAVVSGDYTAYVNVVSVPVNGEDVVTDTTPRGALGRHNQYAGGKTLNQKGGKSLVNEAGPELISDNGEAFIANNGKPGFVDLSDNAIVFNAEETDDILKGRKTVRAKAHANGTRAGLRSRLLNGGRTDAKVSIGVSQKVCPECGEYVAAAIKTCPYCGYRFSGGSEERSSGQQQTNTRIYTDDDNGQRVSFVTDSDTTPTTIETFEYVDDRTVIINGEEQNIVHHDNTRAEESIHGGTITSRRTNRTPSAQETNTTTKKKVGNYVGNGGGGGGVGGANYASQADPKKVDWVAVKINRLQRAIQDLEKVATSGFKKLSKRLDSAKKQISKTKDEIDLMGKAYDRYMQEANDVGLDEAIAKKVREGEINISEYDDETRKKIDEYTEWYEKAIDCQSAIEGLHQSIAQLYTDNFTYIQTDYENQLAQIEHSANMASKDLQMAQTKGYLDNAAYYKQASNLEKQNVKMLKKELSGLNKAFEEAMASGEIAEGSEAWYDMKSAINAVEESIADANIKLEQYKRTLRSLDWSYFDYAQDRFGQLTQEASFLIDLMSNDKLFEKNGQLTKRGTATVGMHALNYDAYMTQADAYRDEIKKINRELAKDPNDTELIARKEQLVELQQQSIQSAEQEKEAMKSLVAQGIQLELDSLKDLIDAYKDSLDSAKDLYEYQKKISEKTADIASLQKQLSAYANDDSEETRAKVQKLNKQLEKSQTELREAEWEQNISEQKKMLDEMYNDYDETLNKRLDNVDQLMKEMIEVANANAGSIKSTIGTVSKEVGYSVSESMSTALTGGEYSNYMKGFEGLATTNQILGNINTKVAAMANAALGVKAYAKGGIVDYTGLAAVHGSPGNPEMVLSAADTEKFLQAAALMHNGLSISDLSEQFAAVHGIFDSYRGSGGIGAVYITIPIDHVQDYNDMVRQMQSDPKFEKMISAMTLDRAVGGSKLRKNLVNF